MHDNQYINPNKNSDYTNKNSDYRKIVINKKIKKIVESACKHMLECSSKKTHLIEEDT